MDFRAVLITLCVLFTHARCRPAGSGDAEENQSLNKTINLALKEIREAWGHLDDSLSDEPCRSVNVTEHVGLKLQPLSARRLSTLHCYMQELSKLTPEVSRTLMTAAQFIKDVEQQLSNSTTPQSCSLPVVTEGPHAYMLAKCFLELVLEERPSKSNL